MATKTVSATGGNWSDGSATGPWGPGGGVPTASDDIVANGTSGNLTLDTTGNCRSIAFTDGTTNYSNTFTMSGQTLNVGTSTVNGSLAATFVAGMTLTINGSSALNFVSTSGTQAQIQTGGKILPNTTFNGAGGSWIFQDAFSLSTSNLTLTAGTLNTNGQTVTVGQMSSSGSTTRALTLGVSSITCSSSSTAWNIGTSTNMTLTANTSTINVTNGGTFNGGGLTYSTVTITANNGNMIVTGSNTYTTLTVTGGAATTNGVLFVRSGTQTITGTLTVNGNSATNRLLVGAELSSAQFFGTAATLNAGTVVASNADFADITAAGAANWNLSAIAGKSGDCGGNSGITFTTSASQTWSGTSGGNWSANAWTSRVPLPQDDVVINKAFSASQTVTADMPRLGRSINWTGSTGTPAWNLTVDVNIFGSVTLISGMTFTGTQNIIAAGRSAYTWTSAGITLPFTLQIVAPGGTYTLQDNLTITVSSAQLRLKNGTFDANGHNVTVPFVNANVSGNTRAMSMGSGTWTVSGTGTIYDTGGAGLTLTASTATLVVSDSSSSSKTLALGSGLSQPAISYTNAGTGTLALTYTGATTVASITVTGAVRTLTFQAGQTLTITSASASLLAGTGTGASRMTIDSSDGSTQATLKCTSGEFIAEFAIIKNNAATGGAQFDAVGQSVAA